MKISMIILFLLASTGRGCQDDEHMDFIITDSGDTVFVGDLVEEWKDFTHDSDSSLCVSDFRISAAINDLGAHDHNKPGTYLEVRRAERLLERLTEKNYSRLDIDTQMIHERDIRKMLKYQKDYKILEAKLNKALQDLPKSRSR